MLKIRRVLISVWEKKGIIELARKLHNLNAEIISTGKTADMLQKGGIPVKEVSSLTAFPEILSGRVKTLHPQVFGGILVNKRNPLHMEEVKNLSIQPFDMVIVNLYPFQEKVHESLTTEEMIEYIDIGGPSLLRAAAKNFRNVACVSKETQYPQIMGELEKNKGFLSEETLRQLAQEAFYVTKEYDTCIFNYFKGTESISWDMEKAFTLRYGENPHQKAGLYRLADGSSLTFQQLQGKELSYNNFLDLDAALNCVKEFSDPAAVIVKHASLCGVGVAKKLAVAYKKAFLTDPISSFGGIISLNRKVDRDTAEQIIKSDFKECIIAPAYSKEALKLFSPKKNVRVIETDFFKNTNLKDIRTTNFGYLIQDVDMLTLDKNSLKIVTKRKPTSRELKDLVFAWKIAKYVKSNAIVTAKNITVIGIGGGQPSRVGSLRIALDVKASSNGAVLASDGFFPKEDSIVLAYKKGIKAIIQPGGSIKDEDIIRLCNKYKIAMVFTGIRHFRH